jgi:ATP-dependent Lhr-like helicase
VRTDRGRKPQNKFARNERSRSAGGVVERTDLELAHGRLIEKMRAVYQTANFPPHLDGAAKELLAEGRAKFEQLRLREGSVVDDEGDLHVFPWRGSQAIAVFGAVPAMAGLSSEIHDLGVTMPRPSKDHGVPLLKRLSQLSAVSAADVADFVQNIKVGKIRQFRAQ